MYAGDSAWRHVVGDMAQHHPVGEGGGQVLPEADLEPGLDLVAEVEDVAVLGRRPLRLALGREVDAGVALVLARGRGGGGGQAGGRANHPAQREKLEERKCVNVQSIAETSLFCHHILYFWTFIYNIYIDETNWQ